MLVSSTFLFCSSAQLGPKSASFLCQFNFGLTMVRQTAKRARQPTTLSASFLEKPESRKAGKPKSRKAETREAGWPERLIRSRLGPIRRNLVCVNLTLPVCHAAIRHAMTQGDKNMAPRGDKQEHLMFSSHYFPVEASRLPKEKWWNLSMISPTTTRLRTRNRRTNNLRG